MTHWTKEPPTEPGWYWWRPMPEMMPVTVQVYGEFLHVSASISEHPIMLQVQNVIGEWGSERIAEPDEKGQDHG